jgi:hypothetical protein
MAAAAMLANDQPSAGESTKIGDMSTTGPRIRAPHLAKVPRMNSKLLKIFWSEKPPSERDRQRIAFEIALCKAAINVARLQHYQGAYE